jgi:small subunit ribosomal protein S15
MDSKAAVEKFGRKPGDTGSTEVQVALITERIRHISGHLEGHKKDHSTRRGLLKLVGQRRRLLRYLAGRSPDRYQSLIAALGLRK